MSERARRRQQRPKLPGWWTLTRDMASFAGGWFMIFQEIQRSDIRESVLLFAGAVIGVPGLAVGATSVADALARRRNGTDDSQPQQAESVES